MDFRGVIRLEIPVVGNGRVTIFGTTAGPRVKPPKNRCKMAEVFTKITYDTVPQALSYLIEKVEKLESLLETTTPTAPVEKQAVWMTMAEFREFHPEHPAPTTVYGWVRNGLIPHYKKGKKLFFKRSEIEAWLNDGRQKTDAEYEAEATDYINRRRTAK